VEEILEEFAFDVRMHGGYHNTFSSQPRGVTSTMIKRLTKVGHEYFLVSTIDGPGSCLGVSKQTSIDLKLPELTKKNRDLTSKLLSEYRLPYTTFTGMTLKEEHLLVLKRKLKRIEEEKNQAFSRELSEM
jgi:hypothetical protein